MAPASGAFEISGRWLEFGVTFEIAYWMTKFENFMHRVLVIGRWHYEGWCKSRTVLMAVALRFESYYLYPLSSLRIIFCVFSYARTMFNSVFFQVDNSSSTQVLQYHRHQCTD